MYIRKHDLRENTVYVTIDSDSQQRYLALMNWRKLRKHESIIDFQDTSSIIYI
jgi:hypothetical protein